MKSKLYILVVALFTTISGYAQIVTMEYGEKDPAVKLVQIQNGLSGVELFHIGEDAAYGVSYYGSIVKYDLKSLKRTHVAKKHELFKAKGKERFEVIYMEYRAPGILMVIRKKVMGRKNPSGIGKSIASSEYFMIKLDENLEMIPSSKVSLFEDVNIKANNGKWPSINVRKNKNEDSNISYSVSVKTYGKTTVKKESWHTKSSSTSASFQSFYANEDFEITEKVESKPTEQTATVTDMKALISLLQSRYSSALIPISDTSYGSLQLKTENQKCLGYELIKTGNLGDKNGTIAKGNFTDVETKNFNKEIAAKGSVKFLGTYATSKKGGYYVVFGYQENSIRTSTTYSSSSTSSALTTSSSYTWNEARVYKLLVLKISDYNSVTWHKTILLRSEYTQAASKSWNSYESGKKALPDITVDDHDNLVIISRSSPFKKNMKVFKGFNLEARSLSPEGNLKQQTLISIKDKNMPLPLVTYHSKFKQDGPVRYYIGYLQKNQRTCLIKVTLNQ